ncbi:MAG TPA: PP2C family protein-serine/threonine phosphatase [Acidimicrobiales bacterium]|nr:PP2C family protein-serine/threonine phosphatase [Acidimicrobiales bacterium]
MAPTVAAHLGQVGMADVALYLVDLDQRRLVHLGPPDATSHEPLDIEATPAGQAFRTSKVVCEPVPAGAGTRMWVPLLDGADRIGVLGTTVAEADEAARDRALHMASITAGLVVSKSAFGDNLLLARRLRHMDLAAEMRWSTLPPLTFTDDRVAVAGMLEPAYEIAGDAFDYAVNGDLAHLAIIDAMGHGLEASRIANLAVGSYRHSRRHGRGLEDTFAALDTVVAEQFGQERFVTGQLVRLDLASGQLTWVNAGHPRPLLWRDGRPAGDLRCETSLPLGMGYVPAEVAQVPLEPGDAVLFLTDGVIDARSPEGEFFGRDRLAEMWLEAGAGGQPPAETVRRLCHALLDHQQGRLQDDATLLMVVWTGP